MLSDIGLVAVVSPCFASKRSAFLIFRGMESVHLETRPHNEGISCRSRVTNCFRRCGNLTSSFGLYIQRSGLEADKRGVAEVDAQHKFEAVFKAIRGYLIQTIHYLII